QVAQVVPVLILLTNNQVFQLIGCSKRNADLIDDVEVSLEGDDFLHIAPRKLPARFSSPKVDQFHSAGEQVDAKQWVARCAPGPAETVADSADDSMQQSHGGIIAKESVHDHPAIRWH